KAAHSCGAREQLLIPAIQVGEIIEVLPLPLMRLDPSDRSHVGDGIVARQELAVCQPLVHDAVQPVALVRIALDRVLDLLLGIVAEVMRLARHWPKATPLPEQPLLTLDAGTLIRRIELAELASEILQDRPRRE